MPHRNVLSPSRQRERTPRQLLIAASLLLLAAPQGAPSLSADELRAGFAQRDITPRLDGPQPVWLAGYSQNRRAAAVHDPLFCCAVAINDGRKTFALASVDLIGLQLPEVERIREGLPQVQYVLVASTHNHEGPDVIGIWGPSPFSSGVDPKYLDLVVRQTIACINEAAESVQPVRASFGRVRVEGLLRDARLPDVRDETLRVLFLDCAGAAASDASRKAGLIVQWNCHPESLGAENALITADFPFAAIRQLEQRYACPAVLFTGAIGGLMTNPSELVFQGRRLKDETFEYAQAYGAMLADQCGRAVDAAEPIRLTPLSVAARRIRVPVSNPLYIAARALGVLNRDLTPANTPANAEAAAGPMAVRSEVACLRLGQLLLLAIPGEIYPELVLGRYQTPVDPGADYPDAPLEPHLAGALPHDQWMLFGMANDEIGYIIPKRQWDDRPPYAYGRTTSQYGEMNSCGSEVAPVIMQAAVGCLQDALRDPP